MKKLFFLLLLIPIALLAAPRKWTKAQSRDRFIQGCKESIRANKVPSGQIPIYDKYCECSGEIFANKFSPEEMEKINQLDKKGAMDAQQQALLQQRLLELMAPCVEGLKKELAEAR